MPVYLGIDYGLERIGLAISDAEGKLAFPLGCLKLKDFGNRKAQLDSLADLARTHGVEAVVIGLPLHEDGSESQMSRQVRNAAARIARRMQIPVLLEPEFLSSHEAYLDLREAGLKNAKLKARLDAQSACRILSSFLSRSRKQSEA